MQFFNPIFYFFPTANPPDHIYLNDIYPWTVNNPFHLGEERLNQLLEEEAWEPQELWEDADHAHRALVARNIPK